MKIAISSLNIPFDCPGGVQIRIRGLIDGLLERGHDVSLVQSQSSHHGSKIFFESHPQVESVIMGKGSLSFSLNDRVRGMFNNIAKELNGRIDLLDTWDPYLMTGNREFSLVHTSYYNQEYFFDHIKHASWHDLSYPLIESGIMRQPIVHFADALVVENPGQVFYLTKCDLVDKKKIFVVPPGVDENKIDLILKNKKMKNTRPSLIYAGRLVESKGIFDLIQAISMVVKVVPEIELVIIGDGKDRLKLEQQIRSLGLTGNVKILGALDHDDTMSRIYSSDAFILPSHFEGFPNSLIESMMLGVPVITAEVGGAPGLLVEHEVTGLLFPPGDVESLKDRIISMLGTGPLREKMITNATNRARDYTLNNMVERTIEAYRFALKERSRQ